MTGASKFCVAAAAMAYFASPLSALAEDRVDVTTTWYQEKRRGNLGGLSVVHQQFDVGTDIGENTTIDLGYSADAVSGATAH